MRVQEGGGPGGQVVGGGSGGPGGPGGQVVGMVTGQVRSSWGLLIIIEIVACLNLNFQVPIRFPCLVFRPLSNQITKQCLVCENYVNHLIPTMEYTDLEKRMIIAMLVQIAVITMMNLAN